MKNKALYINKTVVVRAWGDEPVRLTLNRVTDTHCYVGHKGKPYEVGIRHDHVFTCPKDRYIDMRNAFEQGDFPKLRELYFSDSVENCSCNKYQDTLDSSHDQEGVTDTTGATVSDSQ